MVEASGRGLSQSKVGVLTTEINPDSRTTVAKKMAALGWLKAEPSAASLVYPAEPK